MNFQEAYKELQETHDLPDYSLFIETFPVQIDGSNLTIKSIYGAIEEYLDEYSKHLEGILQPDTSLICMIEANSLSTDKKHVLSTLKKVMYLQREFTLAALDGSKNIEEACMQWQEIRAEIKNIFEKMKNGWKEVTDTSAKELYFG